MSWPKTVAWRRLDLAAGLGLAHFSLYGRGYTVSGREVGVDDNGPWSCEFSVVLDSLWRSRSVHVDVLDRTGRRSLRMASVGSGKWFREGELQPALTSCDDVDLTVTPSTNTLPIRRLGLARGERATIDVVFITVPDLSVTRSAQLYRRDADVDGLAVYRFESPELNARHRLTVDDDGIVVDYEAFAARVAG